MVEGVTEGFCDQMSLGNALEDLIYISILKFLGNPTVKNYLILFISVVLNLFLSCNPY